MIISLDCECTGLDLAHGAMPFLVTTCDSDGIVRFWEWDVDPLTRHAEIPPNDLSDIAELIEAADLIYLHNSKFDTRALLTIGIELSWPKVRDTLVMGHLLASNHRHDLAWMCIEYLGVDIEPYELAVKEVTCACRMLVKRNYPAWRVAEEGAEGMPSVKSSSKRGEDKPWKNDMWLPRALCMEEAIKSVATRGYDGPDQNWLTACSRYANADSEHTLYLGLELERLIRERGLWKIYKEQLNLPRIACEMELYGVTVIGEYTETTIASYEQHVAEASGELVAIAAEFGHDLELAEGASINDNMRDFFYGSVKQSCPRCTYTRRVRHWNDEVANGETCPKCAKITKRQAGALHQLITTRSDNLMLPVIGSRKTGGATLDKDAMQEYLGTTDGAAYDFINLLTNKRKRDTDLTYMRSYQRFWVPVPGTPGYYRVHPGLNPRATDHLRWASNGPNLQNVGKQEDECEECDGRGCDYCGGTGKGRVSVRNCFGPAPGRIWYTMDYESIERRIPAYESRELKMVEVFEHPDEPPYWGNLYLLTASVLYPDEFWPRAEEKDRFKREQPRLYKRSKFFDLAKQYGCGKRKGDLLSGIAGSFDRVDSKFPLLAKLQAHYLALAERTGLVETLPDRSVDPTRGYPILASRMEDGRVLSTTPFNYHVSGTACWCKNRALVRCSERLAHWRQDGIDAHMALEIHDEILFDFPRGAAEGEYHGLAMELKKLMEQSGKDIGIPTPVAIEFHDRTWAAGTSI